MNMTIWIWPALALAPAMGALGFYLGSLRTRLHLGQAHQAQVGALESEIKALKIMQEQSALREQERSSWMAQSQKDLKDSFEQSQKNLRDSFQSLSLQALDENSGRFMQAAKGELDKKLDPVQAVLKQFGDALNHLETNRVGAYEALNQQIKQLLESEQQLRRETHQLSSSLRGSQVRGRWGELQLRRIVEIAGMQKYCDFDEQRSVETENGRLRPDLVVRLPGNCQVVVDAKAPLTGFMEATEATRETYAQKLKEHAQFVRTHVSDLSKKSYWREFGPGPEFVLLFLPGETCLTAALRADPDLIEWSARQQVILATPATLIALLKAVACGWQQQSVAEEAQKIKTIGLELYERLLKMHDYFGETGKNLSRAVESYNRGVASFESRVMVTARRWQAMESLNLDKTERRLTPLEVQTREWVG